MPDEYAPTTTRGLRALVRGEMHRLGPYCDLNHIQVGYITDFTNIFAETQFNGDVSRWDVALGWDFSGMFRDCPFNGDVSKWDVANAENFSNMFSNSNFNGDVSNWEVRNASNMVRMFLNSDFAGDVSRWDVRRDVPPGRLQGRPEPLGHRTHGPHRQHAAAQVSHRLPAALRLPLVDGIG